MLPVLGELLGPIRTTASRARAHPCASRRPRGSRPGSRGDEDPSRGVSRWPDPRLVEEHLGAPGTVGPVVQRPPGRCRTIREPEHGHELVVVLLGRREIRNPDADVVDEAGPGQASSARGSPRCPRAWRTGRPGSHVATADRPGPERRQACASHTVQVKSVGVTPRLRPSGRPRLLAPIAPPPSAPADKSHLERVRRPGSRQGRRYWHAAAMMFGGRSGLSR